MLFFLNKVYVYMILMVVSVKELESILVVNNKEVIGF